MLVIEHLNKLYKGSDKGVFDINLHIEPGDIYAFIGFNGAGKTTTLKCIAQLHDFDSGSITINDLDLKGNRLECKKRMAYIPDNPDLYEYLTGIQYLNFVADIFEMDSYSRTNLIQHYCELFEMTDVLGDLISTYSHGMKQKLAIISALIHQPKLLILDEPFVGLDPKATLRLKEVMHDICRQGGAIFFSTHVLDVAQRLCNKVAMIKDGRMIASGKMEDIVNENTTLEDFFMEADQHA